MFGRKWGGIEQATIDYCEALKLEGHSITAFVRKGAAILPALQELFISIEEIRSAQPWNFLAHRALHEKLKAYDVIIVHGNRAGELTISKHLPPVIAVAHSRFFKARPHFAAIVALSESRAAELHTAHIIPNLIRLPTPSPHPFCNPPVIGVMGRFSPEKGFDLFIRALELLRERDVRFSAVIGGGGELESELITDANRAGLADAITWQGWVEDKNAFFRSLDIFCMPSRTESFPITLLEAMSYGLPIVVTDCGGPAHIITHESSGLLCDIRAEAIADALEHMLNDPTRAATMGTTARDAAERRYALPVVAKQLSAIVQLAAA